MGWTGRAPAPNGFQSARGACQEKERHHASHDHRSRSDHIGMDMGKNTLHMIGLDLRGAIVMREKVSRGRITSRLANVPICLIGIEAGMATHYVARELAALGHDVKQVPPKYAKPFGRGTRMISESPCGSRGGAAADDSLCSRQDRRATGSASAAPGAVASGRRTDCRDQSDSRLSPGARHHRSARTAFPSPVTARHPG